MSELKLLEGNGLAVRLIWLILRSNLPIKIWIIWDSSIGMVLLVDRVIMLWCLWVVNLSHRLKEVCTGHSRCRKDNNNKMMINRAKVFVRCFGDIKSLNCPTLTVSEGTFPVHSSPEASWTTWWSKPRARKSCESKTKMQFKELWLTTKMAGTNPASKLWKTTISSNCSKKTTRVLVRRRISPRWAHTAPTRNRRAASPNALKLKPSKGNTTSLKNKLWKKLSG